MRSTYITALFIAVLFVLWIGSGLLVEPQLPSTKNIRELNERRTAIAEESPATRVRIITSHASLQNRVLSIRGKTQAKRSIVVQSQTSGLVVERPVERGEHVRVGRILCRISVEDRNASILEATAARDQAQLDYEASLKLESKGLQSGINIAQAKARLMAAQASLQRSHLNKDRLIIRAPFAGVVEDIHMELGEYVSPGSACVTLVDLNPMLLTGEVPERDLYGLKSGLNASAQFIDGSIVRGQVTFVAKTAKAGTRTYPVEIEIDNSDLMIPGGITADIQIPVEQIMAHKVSPGLLVLDDAGRSGMRAVTSSNVVTFYPVEIIGDDDDGIWVSGLPDIIDLIIVGQQSVVSGEVVAPQQFSPQASLPLSSIERES
jgi:membrane fusion protein, multidrug efflux system